MEFIQFVVIAIGSFLIFRYILDSVLGIGTRLDKVEKCTLHDWEYGTDGRMFCKRCKKRALEDD